MIINDIKGITAQSRNTVGSGNLAVSISPNMLELSSLRPRLEKINRGVLSMSILINMLSLGVH